MANDGRGEETVAVASQRTPSLTERDLKLRECMDSLSELIDSPQTLTILRNTALTLLELPEHQFDAQRAYALLTYPAVCEEAVSKLRAITPEPWSEGWNQERPQSTGPLYSEAQQNSLTRRNLIRFWVEEWERMPVQIRKHVADLLGSLQ